jgi:hypothetical protein
MSAVLIVPGLGQCDRTCYDAKFVKCTCVCKGAAHRKGLAGAVEAVRKLVAESPPEGAELVGEATDGLFDIDEVGP